MEKYPNQRAWRERRRERMKNDPVYREKELAKKRERANAYNRKKAEEKKRMKEGGTLPELTPDQIEKREARLKYTREYHERKKSVQLSPEQEEKKQMKEEKVRRKLEEQYKEQEEKFRKHMEQEQRKKKEIEDQQKKQERKEEKKKMKEKKEEKQEKKLILKDPAPDRPVKHLPYVDPQEEEIREGEEVSFTLGDKLRKTMSYLNDEYAKFEMIPENGRRKLFKYDFPKEVIRQRVQRALDQLEMDFGRNRMGRLSEFKYQSEDDREFIYVKLEYRVKKDTWEEFLRERNIRESREEDSDNNTEEQE